MNKKHQVLALVSLMIAAIFFRGYHWEALLSQETRIKLPVIASLTGIGISVLFMTGVAFVVVLVALVVRQQSLNKGGKK